HVERVLLWRIESALGRDAPELEPAAVKAGDALAGIQGDSRRSRRAHAERLVPSAAIEKPVCYLDRMSHDSPVTSPTAPFRPWCLVAAIAAGLSLSHSPRALAEDAPPAPLACLVRHYAVTAEHDAAGWWARLPDQTRVPYDDGRARSF